MGNFVYDIYRLSPFIVYNSIWGSLSKVYESFGGCHITDKQASDDVLSCLDFKYYRIVSISSHAIFKYPQN